MKRQYLALIAGMTLMSAMGSIHAFSVFIAPLEALFGVPRAEVSLVYSLALVVLTLSVLFGHRLYALVRPSVMVLITSLIAVTGVYTAGHADSMTGVWIGYSFIFGFANGLGYGFTLHMSARSMPHRKGFAMAILTASYAFGSVLFPYLSESAFTEGGLAAAMERLAVLLAFSGVVATLLLHFSGLHFDTPDDQPDVTPAGNASILLQAKLWLAYGLGVAAGLMAIGHAAGILRANSGTELQILNAPVMVGLGNLLGGLVASLLLDRIPVRLFLMVLTGFSAMALFGISASGLPLFVLSGLIVIGFCYGALICAYPVAVTGYFGALQAPAVYGRVFTAYGISGLGAPWLAGILYDMTGGYGLALKLAAGCAIASLLVARLLPASEKETMRWP